MKKRDVRIILIVVGLVLTLSIVYFILPENLTGKLIGTLDFNLVYTINIDSPENITYNYNPGAYSTYINVSIEKDVESWWYRLIDLTHNVTINNSVLFTPNETFEAVRYSNKLIVFVNDSNGNVFNNSVIFYVNVTNTAPIIGAVRNNLLTCEGNIFSYYLNATDIDEDVLTPLINPTYPQSPFYIRAYPPHPNLTTMRFQIYSGILGKNDAGGANSGSKLYQETVSVRDAEYQDQKKINITVIEINNKPYIRPIGVHTVYLQGTNTTFINQVNVSDLESGDSNSGELDFNISFSGNRLFNISLNGTMNYTANESDIGTHDITVCVSDDGLENIHQNISICGQDGSNLSTCNNFSLVVTSDNRPPQITFFSPSNNSTINVSGTEVLIFNITKYDPDGPAIDTYWHIQGQEIEYDAYVPGVIRDDFMYSFGCGVSGLRTVKAEVTDGELNDSVEWTLNVRLVPCEPENEGGGGGGGGGGFAIFCNETWGCGEWNQCQNLKKAVDNGDINEDLEFFLKERCKLFNWDNELCGYQTRVCIDLHKCNTTINKPGEIKECHYTEFPTCFDGIRNCHDDSCEVGVDCGGPCPACPTCSDGIQNQKEEGIDCGGPCPACPEEVPGKEILPIKILIITGSMLFFIFVIIFIVILMIGYRKKKKELEEIAEKKKL